MFDIGLYGHLVFDKIIDNSTYYSTGGIMNVYRAIKDINKKINVHLAPINIGISSIKIDRYSATRQCDSRLNILDVSVKIKKAKINHIAYLNELNSLNFINYLENTVTADICTGRSITINNKIDYLFISDEDIELVIQNNNVKNTIIHSPIKSYSNNSEYILDNNKVIKNINVLGAGDYFAACYLYGILEKMSEDELIKFSHEKTTEYLLRKKNET